MHPTVRSRGLRMAAKYKNFYVILFSFILLGLIITGTFQFWPHNIETDAPLVRVFRSSASGEPVEAVVVTGDHPKSAETNQSCLFHTCFEVYNCGYNDENRISVYIYPQTRFVDESGVPITLPISREFNEVLQTVADSIYFTNDAERACLYLPAIDLLNQNNLRLDQTSQMLALLPRWNNGTNHLLLNMLPGSLPEYNTVLDVQRGKAILAGGGFNTWTYRTGFDVAVPVFNPMVAYQALPTDTDYDEPRAWLLVSGQFDFHVEYRRELQEVADRHSDFLLLDRCAGDSLNFSRRCHNDEVHTYPDVLQDATFCLVVRGARLGVTAFPDALMAGCIPVVVADSYVLPFSEVLDWTRAAVVVAEDDLGSVAETLTQITPAKVKAMRSQVRFYWENYFNSVKAVTLTTLQIINDRVFPYAARKYQEWNEPPQQCKVQNSLFLPLIPPRSHGFTAVILTYNRLEYLFRVIHQVAKVPSLAKILVVWNNQQKAPPPANVWPKISKPLKVVQTRQNKLSNRFYPYDEIETEAILALDDDIVMLTTDELEFGYEVWREFPDRLVGFPSRLHLWDNSTKAWRYESEWTSEISMVLTGAAFYHKYYSFLYTNSLPGNIKGWVDERMNCEDIAMNFLIANTTGKAPIKVAPRQKFKCPECQNYGLSADMLHMVKRTECINKFTEVYGMMPLKTIEFRADPVLYKDNQTAFIKKFNDIGAL